MRKWIDLFEEWHETIEVSGQHVDVHKNPSPAELSKLMRAHERDHPGSQYPLRAAILRDDTLLVWDSWHATHGEVLSNRNISYVGGYIYLARDHVFFNDLDMDREDGDSGYLYLPLVRRYYEATKRNPSLRAFYGGNVPIIGSDQDPYNRPFDERFAIDDGFIDAYTPPAGS